MTKNRANSPKFVFFGTPTLAVTVLEELEKAGLLPSAVVTTPDEKRGRGLKLSPPPVKEWALARGIPVHQPEKLGAAFASQLAGDVFVVVAYGKILPKSVLDIPKRGVLNVHPSLLPRLRGASPIRSAILNDDKKAGVTVMVLDEEMDHGPIVAQRQVDIPNWPPRAQELEDLLMREGGRLLSQILPEWSLGNIEAREQNHDIATYCQRIQKEDGHLDLSADAYQNLLKIRAYEGWPGTYAFFERPSTRSGQAAKKIRVQIIDAHIENSKLVIETVKPEGKKEMLYADFLRSGATPV